MNIVIPMAGMGKRMRPHTLTTPKPLLPIAGKAIVHRLVEDIAKVCNAKIDNIAFVVGQFGEEAEQNLLKIAEQVGAKGHICYQGPALGTAHAVLAGKELLEGPVVVAYADTLFKAGFSLNLQDDASIWVQKVANPSDFGVVKMDESGTITAMVEKPKEFVSDLAIIGIYYFKDGANLRSELQYLIDNNVMVKGEYYLTDALDNMNKKGVQFKPAVVEEWLDCGNVPVTIATNQRYLEFIKDTKLVADSAKIVNSVVIPPVYLGENVVLENTVVGPYVSVGDGSVLQDVIAKNAIIQKNSKVKNVVIASSMIGNDTTISGNPKAINAGDFNVLDI
jgi:glucose-1-phosphate thymidylyltransferase